MFYYTKFVINGQIILPNRVQLTVRAFTRIMMNTSKTETTKTSIQKPSFSYRKPPFSYSLQKKEENYIYTFDFKIGNGLEKKLKHLFQLKKEDLLESLSNKVLSLNTIVKRVKNYLSTMLPKHHLKENKGIHRALRYFGYHLVGIQKLYPLLIDDYVNEIYVDTFHKPIYLDHQKGRVKTKIKPGMTR